MSPEMTIVPVTLKRANAFVAAHHRHAGPTRGHRFSIGLANSEGELVGVAIAGRPVARGFDDGATVEVTRLCVVDARNGCSQLLGAIVRAARAMGFERVVSYTLPSESGASLRAVGFVLDGQTVPKSWGASRPSRRAPDATPKQRWLLNIHRYERTTP